MTLNELNHLSYDEAVSELTKCCGSTNWVAEMIRSGPYESEESLLKNAEKIWFYCFEDDWLEAFEHHPKIGDTASLQEKFSTTKDWAGDEQQGVQVASQKVLEKLVQLNKAYEKKFGFIFIVCATGKSAEEMLALLEGRIENDYEHELPIAMGEQNQITLLRLKKLLS
ncbi:MAG: 2-oxo-4-hydroxy-4-carboxy-5-ureidoimidazoline decarboxylase [Cyclobacteriaceae bacterium]